MLRLPQDRGLTVISLLIGINQNLYMNVTTRIVVTSG